MPWNAVEKNKFYRVFLTFFCDECGESRWIIYFHRVFGNLTKKTRQNTGWNLLPLACFQFFIPLGQLSISSIILLPGVRSWKYELGDLDKNWPWSDDPDKNLSVIRFFANYCELVRTNLKERVHFSTRPDHAKLSNYNLKVRLLEIVRLWSDRNLSK